MDIQGRTYQKYDSLENWVNADPVLNKGEIGVISDDNTLKIGNGSSNFKSLNPLGYATQANFDALQSLLGSNIAIYNFPTNMPTTSGVTVTNPVTTFPNYTNGKWAIMFKMNGYSYTGTFGVRWMVNGSITQITEIKPNVLTTFDMPENMTVFGWYASLASGSSVDVILYYTQIVNNYEEEVLELQSLVDILANTERRIVLDNGSIPTSFAAPVSNLQGYMPGFKAGQGAVLFTVDESYTGTFSIRYKMSITEDITGIQPNVITPFDFTNMTLFCFAATTAVEGVTVTFFYPAVDDLPVVSSTDDGKILQVLNGLWQPSTKAFTTEQFTFTLSDGTTVTKNIVIAN